MSASLPYTRTPASILRRPNTPSIKKSVRIRPNINKECRLLVVYNNDTAKISTSDYVSSLIHDIKTQRPNISVYTYIPSQDAREDILKSTLIREYDIVVYIVYTDKTENLSTNINISRLLPSFQICKHLIFAYTGEPCADVALRREFHALGWSWFQPKAIVNLGREYQSINPNIYCT